MPSSPTIKFGKNLPKVTQYVRNIGKSISYSTIDYFKGTMEDTSDFVESNQELFKDIYHAARDYRNTMRAVDRSIKSSKVYEAGQGLKKSLFESIRTGKFYDAKRQAEYELQAAGDMAKMDDFEDEWGSSNEFDISMDDQDFDQSNEGKSSAIVSGAIQDATSAQAGIIARSTDYLAETQKASTKLLFAQGEKMYAAVNNGLANTQALISRVNTFLDGPLTTHMENSTKFYQETTNKMNEITAMIKESLEMQRNLYKREQSSYKQSQFSNVGTNPDLKEYAKEVKKNFIEFLGPEAQILFSDDMGEGSNMFMALVANPLKFIPDFLVRSIVPATVKKSLESIDKSFTGLFANMIARFNNWAKDTSDAPEVLKQLGRIFGLKLDEKTTVNTGKYNKGAIPFDGITKKAITEVIPGYLARIESALTSTSERIFDYNSGRWTDIKTIERDYKVRRSSNYKYGAFDVSDDVRDYISELRRHDAERAKRMEESYNKIIKKIYEDYGQFEPYRPHGFGDDKEDPWDYYDIDKEDFLRLANLMIGSTKGNGTRNRNAMQLAAAMQDARESWSRQLRSAEASGHDVLNQLFNNAYKIDMNSDEPSIAKTGGTGLKNVIANATDKYNKNIFFYLRGIYSELITIRSFGGFGGGSRHGYNRRVLTNDPLADLEKKFNMEIEAEAARQASANVTIAKDQENFNEDAWLNIKNEKKKAEDEELKKKGIFGKNKSDSDKGFLAQLLEAGSLGAKFKVIQNNINSLLAKPGLAIAGVIDTADKRLFQLVFGSKEGEEITDKDGRTVKGFLEYMVMRTRETFDKMNDWIDENILEPLKTKLGVKSFSEFFVKLGKRFGLDEKWNKVKGVIKEYSRPVIDRLKYKGGRAWSGFKGAMDRTYGRAYRAMASILPNQSDSQVAGIQDQIDQLVSSGMMSEAEAAEYATRVREQNEALGLARGGLVTRRGLAIISPGERVIPIGGKVTQRNNLVAEKAFAKRYGIPNSINYYAEGNTTNPEDQPVKESERDVVERTIKKVTSEVMGNTQNKGIANVIASGLIGGGVSLITGLVGGPLLGVAVGSAVGIAENSKTVQNWLFGEEVVDAQGNKSRSGGVISKDLQDKFKKYFPSMRDFGLAGAVAGLFTPFGIVGGLLAGSAIGFAKETDTFKDFIYGKENDNGERDGGLLKKEFREKVKKAAPRMLVGAVGGALLGPFGILGNAVLGSAMGYVTTTDKFREVIFGKEDENGKRKGGVLEALYNGLLKPAIVTGKNFIEKFTKFTEEKIFKPLENFVNPFLQLIKNTITGIGDHMKDFLTNMAQNTIGTPLKDFLEHKVFRGVMTWTRRLLFLPAAVTKGLISAPFAALGAIGKNMTMGQIRRGTATNMTAAQRNDFRKQHFGRRLIIGRQDIFNKLDRDLAGMKGQEGIDKMKEMRDQLKIYINTKDEVGNQVAELVKEAGEILSDYLNNAPYREDTTKSIYDVNKYSHVKKIHQAIADGDINKVTQLVYKLNGIDKTPGSQADQLIEKLTPIVAKIKEGRRRQANSRIYQRELQSKLSWKTGGALHNTRNIRRFSRMLDTEIDAREAELAEMKAKNPEQAAAETINDTINKRANDMIFELKAINFGIKVLTGQAEWGNNEDPFVQKTVEEQRVSWSSDDNFDPDSTVMPGDENFVGPMPAPSNRDSRWKKKLRKIGDRAPGIFGKFSDWRAESAAEKVKRKELRAQKRDDAIKSIGGIVTGGLKNIRESFSKSYHVMTTPAGETAAVDQNGRTIPGTGNTTSVKKYLAEQVAKNNEEKTRSAALMKNIGDISGAILGKTVSTITKPITWIKDGIGGLLGMISNNTGIVGRIFGALPKLGLLAVGVAASGHLAELWTNTLWPKITEFLGPIFDKIKGFLGNIWGGIVDFLGEDSIIVKAVNGIGNFISDLIHAPGDALKSMWDWLVDGWNKAIQFVVTPLWENVLRPGLLAVTQDLLPYIGTMIWNVLNGNFETENDIFAALGGKNTETVKKQAVNSEGQKLYKTEVIDANGNKQTVVTTDQYSTVDGKRVLNEAYIYDTTITTVEYKNDTLSSKVRNDIFGKGRKTDYRKEATDAYGRKFTMYISAQDDDRGSVNIICNNTGEYIRFTGIDYEEFSYGYICDDKGKAITTGGKIGVGIGATAFVAASAVSVSSAIAGGASTGAALGSIVPGIGTIIGLVVGGVLSFAVGSAVAAYVYEMADGSYRSQWMFPRNCAECTLLCGYFGWPLDDNIDNWPSFIVDEEYANKALNAADVATLEEYKNEYSSKTATQTLTDAGYTPGTDTSSALPVNGSSIGIYNSYEKKVKYEKISHSNDNQMKVLQFLRKYTTYDGKEAYYDTRKTFSSLPPEIQEVVGSSDNWTANSESDPTPIGSFPTYPISGSSRKKIGFNKVLKNPTGSSAKSRHLYQNAADLSKKRFGNTTIGDAGCGPVAATNLLNRLSGRGPGMDLDSATNMALGYTDSTGGTTMDYFKDILNANGYDATETDSKQDLLSSIASGNPAVLLGNSGKEHGTPFGANNHYINAMGIDKSGKNMIVEDPDLPQSTVKYPIKDVMKDTISGVATFGGGFGRKISDFFKKKKRPTLLLSGKAKTNEVTVSKIALRAAPIIYAGESSGKYDAINPNDNGAVSVGLIQWHGGRARSLLHAIIQDLGEAQSLQILGTDLYNKIVTKSDSYWNTVYFSKNSSEVAKIKKLLNTSSGQKVQNAQMVLDLNSYITSIKKKGIKDEGAIIFLCHVMNAYGHIPNKFLTAARLTAGSNSNITLDDIYNACLTNSYYKKTYSTYAKKVYNAIKNSSPVGDGTTTVDAGSISVSNQTTMDVMEAANTDADSSDEGSTFMNALSNIGTNVFTKIHGSMMNKFLAGSNSITGGTTSEYVNSTGSNGTGVNVNIPPNASTSEKQRALVATMASIKGKIKYGLGSIQDPDKGTASCASTVAWAYDKVLGFKPGGVMFAGSTSQAKDTRFTDVYVNNGGGFVPLSNLQPGDIMYFNWDRTTNNNKMHHTEMYSGEGYDWSHGGNPKYGPVEKDLDNYRLTHLMKVRRYNDFMSGSGRSRRKRHNVGYARVDTSTLQKANNVINKYGISSNLISANNTSDEAIYAQYFAAMITLLSVIADNTEALSSLQIALANRGATISTEQLQKAAGNARKRAAKARQAQNTLRQNSKGFIDFGDSTDMENILNGPTGYIVKTMEALAQE